MRRIVTTIATAIAFAGIAAAGPNEDALLAADRAFAEMAAKDGVPAAFRAFVAEDGRMFGGKGELAQGPVAVGAMMDEIYGTAGKLAWIPRDAIASTDGTLGYTFGRWRYENGPDVEGKMVSFGGTYVTIWERQADGSYKFDFDFGAPDGGPEDIAAQPVVGAAVKPTETAPATPGPEAPPATPNP